VRQKNYSPAAPEDVKILTVLSLQPFACKLVVVWEATRVRLAKVERGVHPVMAPVQRPLTGARFLTSSSAHFQFVAPPCTGI
jgi:hypothetical protein